MDNGDSFAQEEGVSPPPITPLSARHNKKSELSCLICARRIFRCDKKIPCSRCVYADILYYYPAPKRTSRQPQKTTITEVSAHLARLKRTITALSNGASSRPESDINSISAPTPSRGSEVGMTESRTAGGSHDELIIQDGYSSRYINEALLLRVLEEVSLRLLIKESC
jgi:ribosomal protein L37E